MGRAVLALSDAGRGSLAHLALLDACAEQQRSGADLRVALLPVSGAAHWRTAVEWLSSPPPQHTEERWTRWGPLAAQASALVDALPADTSLEIVWLTARGGPSALLSDCGDAAAAAKAVSAKAVEEETAEEAAAAAAAPVTEAEATAPVRAPASAKPINKKEKAAAAKAAKEKVAADKAENEAARSPCGRAAFCALLRAERRGLPSSSCTLVVDEGIAGCATAQWAALLMRSDVARLPRATAAGDEAAARRRLAALYDGRSHWAGPLHVYGAALSVRLVPLLEGDACPEAGLEAAEAAAEAAATRSGAGEAAAAMRDGLRGGRPPEGRWAEATEAPGAGTALEVVRRVREVDVPDHLRLGHVWRLEAAPSGRGEAAESFVQQCVCEAAGTARVGAPADAAQAPLRVRLPHIAACGHRALRRCRRRKTPRRARRASRAASRPAARDRRPGSAPTRAAARARRAARRPSRSACPAACPTGSRRRR